jgi:hypothetical protein
MNDIVLVAFVTLAWSSIGFVVALALGRMLRYQSPIPEEEN